LPILLSLPTFVQAAAWQPPPQPESHEDELTLLLKLNKEIKSLEAVKIQDAKKNMANTLATRPF
jgi:hypothetical protein